MLYETGVAQKTNGKYDPLRRANATGNAVTVPTTSDVLGFIHTHPNYVLETNPALGVKQKHPLIPMFSPKDLEVLLKIAKNANGTNFTLSQAYAAVVTPEGNYLLKFGNSATSVPTMNGIGDTSMKILYRSYIENSKYKAKAFMSFLRDILEITTIEIYEFETDTGTVKRKYVDKNGNIQETDC